MKTVSDRKFGIIFGLILLVFALVPLVRGGEMRPFLLLPSLLLLGLGILAPHSLRPFKNIWMTFAHFNAFIIGEIAVILVYAVAIVPTAFVLRAFGKDLLRLKKSGASTYWVDRKEPLGPMKNQF